MLVRTQSTRFCQVDLCILNGHANQGSKAHLYVKTVLITGFAG